jgi:hypothetical protein
MACWPACVRRAQEFRVTTFAPFQPGLQCFQGCSADRRHPVRGADQQHIGVERRADAVEETSRRFPGMVCQNQNCQPARPPHQVHSVGCPATASASWESWNAVATHCPDGAGPGARSHQCCCSTAPGAIARRVWEHHGKAERNASRCSAPFRFGASPSRAFSGRPDHYAAEGRCAAGGATITFAPGPAGPRGSSRPGPAWTRSRAAPRTGRAGPTQGNKVGNPVRSPASRLRH